MSAEEPLAPQLPHAHRKVAAGRALVLVAAFLAWFFAGMFMSTTQLSMRAAAIDLLGRTGSIDRGRFDAMNKVLQGHDQRASQGSPLSPTDEAQLKDWRASAQQWFAFFQCALLFGAAAGGLLFGLLGDRIGRSPALGCSILWFSLLSLTAGLARTPVQLLVLWFLASLGVGGIWPNGVALLAETWSDLSRPLVSGIMGTSANVGIFVMATVATQINITPDHWQWVLFVTASPAVLGLLVLVFVPESPKWLASRADRRAARDEKARGPDAHVFRMPLAPITLVGIMLATIPLIGGWGSANWMIPWAAEAVEGASLSLQSLPAQVGQARALTGMLGSLLGGWVAHVVGRRASYSLVSILALACAQYAFWFLVPTDASFLFWVAALGFLSGIYFGWLPLFLPELFPTRVRSTGAGVSFNFGRILTAVTVFATGALTTFFGGDYARIGQVTSLIYALGIIAIWFAPDTTKRQLGD